MAIYDFTRQIWNFVRAITFVGAHFFKFFFAEYSRNDPLYRRDTKNPMSTPLGESKEFDGGAPKF